jgi:RND family efflux transporter MFP subunit
MEAGAKKPRRRVLLWSLAGVLVVGAGVVGLTVMTRRANGEADKKKKGEEGPVAAPVELTAVRRGDINTWLQTTTVLEARNAATVVARREGPVVELLAEEGAWFEKGQALARLDDTEALLAFQRAEVAAEIAKRESERGKQLQTQGFLSGKEWDDLELRTRQTQVELEQARYNVTQTRIAAPFSGRVTERLVNLGENVTAGKECFRMAEFNPLLARLYFPERELPRLRVGQEAVVTLEAYPGREFSARVSLVNPVVDRSNGTFKVTLEMANPQGTLRPGTFARVRLKTGGFSGAMLLPRRGLLSEDGEHYVFVARGDSAVKVSVQVGAVENDTAQILAGLTAGDRVVTIGQGGLKQGAKIKPVSF